MGRGWEFRMFKRLCYYEEYWPCGVRCRCEEPPLAKLNWMLNHDSLLSISVGSLGFVLCKMAMKLEKRNVDAMAHNAIATFSVHLPRFEFFFKKKERKTLKIKISNRIENIILFKNLSSSMGSFNFSVSKQNKKIW